MNEIRRQILKDQEDNDIELFEKIKNNPRPSPADLWSLSEERFIEWRRLNDFPNLLKLFSNKFLKFQEWKSENNLTDEIIIQSGYITPFLEKKKTIRDKALYLTKQVFNGKESLVVSYNKLEGPREYLGQKFEFTFIKKITSYLDWLSNKKLDQKILYTNSRSSMKTDNERVYIHADVYSQVGNYELLKMGGVELPVDAHGILFKGKVLEFVNLCGLKLNGNIYFGENGNLSCSYCVCDNWRALEIELSSLDLNHCSVENFTLYNSKIQQWNIYNCNLSGDFYNTKLYDIKIVNGHFNPILLDCHLSNTHISNLKIDKDHNFLGYRKLKKAYQNQGDDEIASTYNFKENEFIRGNSKGWAYLTKTLSFYYWEYGRKPHRIIYLSIAIIVFFGLIFWLAGSLVSININSSTELNFGDYFYFSTITFTTLGYGDMSPHGWLKLLTSIESFLGVINTGFLIAGYSNTKY